MLWSAVKKIEATDPWIIGVLLRSVCSYDDRILPVRVNDSISFIAPRPFEKVDPEWKGMGEFHPFFNGSRRAESDGVYYQSCPIVVFHYEGKSGEYGFIELSPLCDAPVGTSMKWYVEDAHKRNLKITFDAIVKPLVVKINPHHKFAESYEIFKVPANFDVDDWILAKTRQKAFSSGYW